MPSAFISPSGLGLKVLVKIPAEEETHKSFFNSLQQHFGSPYFDETCKNVSRVCYESYDPLIYINEQSSVFNQITEEKYQVNTKHKDVQTIPITDENKIVEILLKWWERKKTQGGERTTMSMWHRRLMTSVNKTLAEYVMSNPTLRISRRGDKANDSLGVCSGRTWQ